MKIYHELLTEHYRNPRNKGHLKKPDFSSAQFNPSCGDSVLFEGHIRDGRIEAIAFDGTGCVISQAAASLLSELVIGKTLDEVLKLDTAFMKELVGIPLGPVRLKCALLPLQALQDGLNRYLIGQEKDAQSPKTTK